MFPSSQSLAIQSQSSQNRLERKAEDGHPCRALPEREAQGPLNSGELVGGGECRGRAASGSERGCLCLTRTQTGAQEDVGFFLLNEGW